MITLIGLWQNPSRDGWASMTAGYTLLAAFFAALLLYSLAAPPASPAARFFAAAPLRALGKYSYGLYVYHSILGPAFDRAFGQRRLDSLLRSHLHLGRAAYATSVLLFVILAGEGVLRLGDDELPVRSGSVVARPPGTGVAHAFQAGGDGLSYLAYGTREPGDMCFYPRSNKVSFRGLGVIGRIERLDYWDGED